MKNLAPLRAVFDGFLPALSGDDFQKRTASDLRVAERCAELLKTLGPRQQADFQQLAWLLGSPLLGLTWGGRLVSADKLRPDELEKMLQKWSASPIEKLRFGFGSLRKLAGLLFLGDALENGQPNPNWATVGYPGPLEKPANSPVFEFPKTENWPASGQIDCDILVIGSGSGGGVAASILAAAGHDVVVVEKGPRPVQLADNQLFATSELAAFQQFYEMGGLCTSADGAVSLLAGSVLGGGSTINWAGTFRTPDYVLDEWANEHGNPDFLKNEFQSGFDFLEKRMGVRPAERDNPQNESLKTGAEKLSWRVNPIPVNQQKPAGLDDLTYWKSMGYSPLGDSAGVKQGTAATFLKDAVRDGARLFCDFQVDKIVVKNGAAVGAVGSFFSKNGEARRVEIRAKKVVVAAGAIHTPALLMRSGLRHPQLGRNLFLHPTTAVTGWYSEPSDAWHGHMMSQVCDEWTRLTGNFGAKLETPPVHPGLLASAIPWTSGEAYKKELRRLRFARLFIVLTRDKFGGQVVLGKNGQPEIRYGLSDFDRQHFIRGQAEALRCHVAAGCEEAMIAHNSPLYFSSKTMDLEAFLPKIGQLPWQKHRFGLFSAHQMGTARMGNSSKLHPVLPTGETREVRQLFVADGSLFPSASGANPMLSIMNLARFVASQIGPV